MDPNTPPSSAEDVDLLKHVRGLVDPDLSTRRSSLDALIRAKRPSGGPWVEPVFEQLSVETESAVQTGLMRLLGEEDPENAIPLEMLLATRGRAISDEVIRLLVAASVREDLFFQAFTGLGRPQRRALAGLLLELHQADPESTGQTLKRCLDSGRAPEQRVALAALLELPEDASRSILKEFPEELIHTDASDAYDEVIEISDTRRLFRNEGLGYFPLRRLGQGAMGKVYLCRDLSQASRLAALKCIRPQGRHGLDPDLLARFQREARAPRLLDHPNIVPVRGHGVAGDLHWIDVDFIQGETLQEMLERQGSLPWEKALDFALQLARALGHVHGRGLVHRDVKPANIFIERETGRLILGDFGLVVVRDEELQKEIPSYTPTATHVVLGSPGYMSLEQCISSSVDGRADLFSLGVVLYQMLEGWLPYSTPNLSLYMAALAAGRPPEAIQSNVPPGAREIVEKLLSAKPEARFQAAVEVEAALKKLGPKPNLVDLESQIKAVPDRPSGANDGHSKPAYTATLIETMTPVDDSPLDDSPQCASEKPLVDDPRLESASSCSSASAPSSTREGQDSPQAPPNPPGDPSSIRARRDPFLTIILALSLAAIVLFLLLS